MLLAKALLHTPQTVQSVDEKRRPNMGVDRCGVISVKGLFNHVAV